MGLEKILRNTGISTCWLSQNENTGVSSKQYTDDEDYTIASKFLNDIFYAKKALGKNGKPFKAYKFRTMQKDSDSLFLKIASKEGFDEKGNLKNDPRITPLGRVLRKYWIDELPQFYNVLKGDMKLVGVRPFEKHHWKAYPADIKNEALKYKPGLFGVNYAFSKNFPDLDGIGLMREYLKEYGEAPFRTDVKYFGRIVSNIFFHGMRSS